MAFTTWGQVTALTDREAVTVAMYKLGYWTLPTGVSSSWDAAHLVAAIWRDRIQYIWILDVDNVRDIRHVYCDSGTHAGNAIPIATLAADAVNDANPSSSGSSWRDKLNAAIAAWSGVSIP